MVDATARGETPIDALVAAARPVPAAELSVMPMRARLSLRANEDEAIGRIGEALGTPLPRRACTFERNGAALALWLGPDEWLLLASEDEPHALVERLAGAAGPAAHSLVDVSERSVSIIVSGPRAETVLAAGCPLDLSLQAFPVGMATRTVFAKSEIVLARLGETEFLIDVWRSFSPYVWRLLEESRHEFVE